MNTYLQKLRRELHILIQELGNASEAADKAVIARLIANNKAKQSNYLNAFNL